MTLRLAFIGFGAVGRGLAELLHTRAGALAATHDFRAQIVGVSTRRAGVLFHPSGLDIASLLAGLYAYPAQPGLRDDLDTLTMISRPEVDVVIEVSPTDLQTGEPALGYVRAALAAGKHVVTANKGPVALAFHELSSLARQQGLFFGYEGTVMGGTPALRLAQSALAGSTIRAVRGILNGTTNYILTSMEKGDSYAASLAEAQRLGYAEADPRGDVEGFDAAGKLVILANIVLGVALRIADVECTGITGLTPEAIESARAAGERWKLIAEARRAGEDVVASVRPQRLPITDPLAGVGGVMNAVTYETDILGPVTLIGPGAGGRETALALLADLLWLHRRR